VDKKAPFGDNQLLDEISALKQQLAAQNARLEALDKSSETSFQPEKTKKRNRSLAEQYRSNWCFE
jgi:hypothetical protein